MHNWQPLPPGDSVLGLRQKTDQQPTANSMIHPFFLPLESVISKQINPWMSNVLQMKGIYNTAAGIC